MLVECFTAYLVFRIFFLSSVLVRATYCYCIAVMHSTFCTPRPDTSLSGRNKIYNIICSTRRRTVVSLAVLRVPLLPGDLDLRRHPPTAVLFLGVLFVVTSAGGGSDSSIGAASTGKDEVEDHIPGATLPPPPSEEKSTAVNAVCVGYAFDSATSAWVTLPPCSSILCPCYKS